MKIRCRLGYHKFGLWQCETHQVPLFKTTDGEQVGWTYEKCTGPSYRKCTRPGCRALEFKGT